ncbi:MAG: sugar ABC transporter permease [Chloroflexi bacterium]|nr:sugar ABC transporter permease [Chloroflexota bacterium]
MRRRLSLTIKLLILLVAVVFALYPIAYVLSAALNPLNTLVGQGLIPTRITFENFERLFTTPLHPWPRWILNSVVVSGVTAVVVVSLSAVAAYSFSRFRYRGRRTGLLALIIVQLFPNMLGFVALFILLQAVGDVVPMLGLDSLGGLILVYCGGALGFNTWLMKAYFDTVPRDLDESARVDGASHFQTFRLVILPLVRPILAVIAILTFIATYGDFLLARVLLSSTENYTLAVGMTLFLRQYSLEWGTFGAAAMVGALPIVVIFLLLQRQLVSGLALGGVKG